MDEVGRGCWAGPVTAGAVILGRAIPGVKDSKLLNRAQRELLDAEIRDQALATGLGWADVREINALGLTGALRLTFTRALAEITMAYQEIILDGNYNFLAPGLPVRTLVDADATQPSVSAASIIAKVARDNYMIRIAEKYPGYNFEKHVGYGTKLHREAVARLGICELHRVNWKPIKELLA